MKSGKGVPIPSSVTPAVNMYSWKSESSKDAPTEVSGTPVVLKNS